MIDPETVALAMPAHDGRMMIETCITFILNRHKYLHFTFPAECTGPSLVRSIIAHKFLDLPNAEWLVCVDNDIAATPRDWDYLMEPTSPVPAQEGEPEPSRTECPMIDFPDGGGEPIRSLGGADAIVCAEYPYKQTGGGHVKLGMGFVRIHRSVFEALDELNHPDDDYVRLDKEFFDSLPRGKANPHNPDADLVVEVPVSKFAHHKGDPRVQKMFYQGNLISNYFPEGQVISSLIPGQLWKGEDHGFFTLCLLAGITPRIERRTRLTHIGRKGYEYVPESEEIIGQ